MMLRRAGDGSQHRGLAAVQLAWFSTIDAGDPKTFPGYLQGGPQTSSGVDPLPASVCRLCRAGRQRTKLDRAYAALAA